jgi:hypothetical protein
MKWFITSILLVMVIWSTVAQSYAADAAAMMQPGLSGTARSLGVGGAFSSIGGDLSCMSSNPAGVALFSKSEFDISGGGNIGSNTSQYLDKSSQSKYSKGLLSQAGFAFTSRKLSPYNDLAIRRKGSKLDRFILAIGFQQLADFTTTQNFNGTNTSNSYEQAVASSLNTGSDQIGYPIPANNSLQSALVRYDSAISKYAPVIGQPIYQTGSVTSKGALRDINLTMGFNIGNTIYIGIGVGMPYMSYSSYYSFAESNAGNDSVVKTNYGYTISGLGVNGKLGMIFKPTKWLRLGASFQTPTSGSANTKFGDSTNYFSPYNSSNSFQFYNPLKATFGVSFYVKQWAIISVDYEIANYSGTHYHFDGDQSASIYWNTLISSKYRLSSTLKAGIEVSYKKLRLRGGIAWSQSPVRDDSTTNGYASARLDYTAGIGLRGKVFFADLAYVRTLSRSYYAPYSYSDTKGRQQPGVYTAATANVIVVTVGFTFGKSGNQSIPVYNYR